MYSIFQRMIDSISVKISDFLKDFNKNNKNIKNRVKYNSGTIINIIDEMAKINSDSILENNKMVYFFILSKNTGQENDFEFRISVLNKGKNNIRNLWVNFYTNISNMHFGLSETATKNCNTVMNNFSQGLSANLKDEFVLSPRMVIDYLYFKIPKKSLENNKEYSFEFSFGSDISDVIEFKSKWTQMNIEKINNSNDFVKFIKSKEFK